MYLEICKSSTFHDANMEIKARNSVECGFRKINKHHFVYHSHGDCLANASSQPGYLLQIFLNVNGLSSDLSRVVDLTVFLHITPDSR